ncbi:hypothetical protein C1645_839835 [Glomus cerebriforme]|uniref:Uncharacterized protein n=1 Tax=Glomus cerebriforme TaxID=658196 RepID=A0A397S1J5_9GLOM|nr:hypothetical protein C1645_839835 [Glomus cerebriforme]
MTRSSISFKNKPFELIWLDDVHLEQTNVDHIFDKYRPNRSFTKAAKGTAKITNFMNKSRSISDDF